MSNMKSYRVITKMIIGWVLALLSSGCVGLIIPPYGFVASDARRITEPGRDIVMPENAPSISQGYNPQVTETEGIIIILGHNGIDIIHNKGTPVMAAAAGCVIRSSYGLFYGHQIIIDHGPDPSGRIFRSKYLHLEKRLVREGDVLIRGQCIGTMGRTGLLAGFTHLHYEILRSSLQDMQVFASANPHRFWADGMGVVTCFDKNRHWPDRPFVATYPVPCRGVDWQ